MSVAAATGTRVFLAFVEHVLVPALRGRPDVIVVMDNLSPHKAPPVRQLIESRGARMLLLPPYSPDVNPIEQAISKVKTVLRKLARRTADGLYDGIGEALASVTPADAVAYIRHCGYVLQ